MRRAETGITVAWKGAWKMWKMWKLSKASWTRVPGLYPEPLVSPLTSLGVYSLISLGRRSFWVTPCHDAVRSHGGCSWRSRVAHPISTRAESHPGMGARVHKWCSQPHNLDFVCSVILWGNLCIVDFIHGGSPDESISLQEEYEEITDGKSATFLDIIFL